MSTNLVTEKLQKSHVKIVGEIREVQTLRDGNLLMRDDRTFYKVTENSIKPGYFKRGKFHFYPQRAIQTVN